MALAGIINEISNSSLFVNDSEILSGKYKKILETFFLTNTFIIAAVGFCDAEFTTYPLNSYFWPEIELGSTATLPCVLGPSVPNGMARRTCNPELAQWNPVALDECFKCNFN